MIAFRPELITVDLLPPILENLSDRRDLYASSLVSWTFNRAATPLLYRTLDSRIVSKDRLFHPSKTILSRPELAQYVRRVTETGAVHTTLSLYYPSITQDVLNSLRLCKNLETIAWIDDSFSAEHILLSFLDVLCKLPVRDITIRTYSDLGEEVWARLKQFTGLRRVKIWCIEGPPRVLQGWAETLGSSLTHLELGRCAGVPATILILVFSQLPLLQDLRLKGAQSAAIPVILTYLPKLLVLDTEYLGSGVYRPPNRPLPFLRSLTVRANSMDSMGPQQLWTWIRNLIPHPNSLESFTLDAFSVQGQTTVPRRFILTLAEMQSQTLRKFLVGMTQLNLNDINHLCTLFPMLEDLKCYVTSPNVAAVGRAIANAQNLRTLKLHVQWIPEDCTDSSINKCAVPFTLEHATQFMLHNNPRLRMIGIGSDLYKGRWVLRKGADGVSVKEFEVVKDVAHDRWV